MIYLLYIPAAGCVTNSGLRSFLEKNINSIRLINLDEAVATMYPLIQPSFEDLADLRMPSDACAELWLTQVEEL